MTNIVVAFDTVGTFNKAVPSAVNISEALGYYDIENQQYWFSCPYGVNPETGALVSLSQTAFCPGYKFDATNWQIAGEYVAKATGAGTPGGAICGVKTDVGSEGIIYNLATPYYPKVSQVLAGVVLDQDFNKTSENVLRVIYSFVWT